MTAMVVAATSVVVVLGSALPASARESWCEKSVGGDVRGACVVLNNQAVGFAHGRITPTLAGAGPDLRYVHFHQDCHRCANNNLRSPIAPGAQGGSNATSGVASSAQGVFTWDGHQGSNPFPADTSKIEFYVNTPNSGGNSSDCRTYLTTYLSCTYQWGHATGSNLDEIWHYTVFDRPYVFTVTNRTNSSLKEVYYHREFAIPSPGSSGVHTLGSIAPACNSCLHNNTTVDLPTDGHDTGFLVARTHEDKTAHFELKYRLEGGESSGNDVVIKITVPARTGTITGSCEKFPANAPSLNCKVNEINEAKYEGTNYLNVDISR